jgi:hypothetical protein
MDLVSLQGMHSVVLTYISLNLIRIILDRHTSYNVDDLKAPSIATNK